MKKVINTRKILLDLKDNPIKGEQGKPFTVGEAVANLLGAYKAGGKMKCYLLAKDFIKEKEVVLDEADVTLVKSAIEAGDELSNNTVLGQLLLEMENLPEAKGKKDSKSEE